MSDTRLISKHASALHGVLSFADVASLIAEPHKNELHRRLRRLEEGGILKRYARGIYLTSGYSPRALSQKLRPNSYVSFGNILADARLIGSVPAHQIDAVALGRPRSFDAHGLAIRYFRIQKSLYFGFESIGGIALAKPEKALLDTLYFHQHGARFFFDVFSDVNVARLSRATLDAFLGKYKNQRFKTFVKDYLRERGLAKSR